jgi:hypothetical protein
MVAWGDALFIIIAIAEIAIDFLHPHTISCVKHKGLHIFLFLLFHHLIASFMMYGWLLPNKKLLFLFIIANLMMLMEWMIHGHCRLTAYANNVCGWKSNTPFRDLMWKLGLKDIRIGRLTLHVILAVAFLLLGIYLYRRKS